MVKSKPKARKIDLPRILDRRGNITVIEGDDHVPFPIKRVFYLYDVPGGAERGGHALKTCEQFLVAVSGSFDVKLDDGRKKTTVRLDRPYYGLYLPPLTWRELVNFSSGSVCLVLTSEHYKKSDYYRDYAEFRKNI
ncbi:MAG: FdtA/QdtA family cupin domain-containing protein [Elusimicrobiota bacterium]